MQEFCIETRVQKMQYRMLYTTDIHIYRKHLVRFFSGNQFFVIVTVHITQEVPGRTSPLRHGICLTFCVFSTNRTLAVYPLFDSGKRRFSGSCRFIRIYIRQTQRQLFFRYRHCSTFRTVYNRNRLSPVTLTGEYPITQLIVYSCFSNSTLFNDMWSFFLENG